MAPAAQSSAKNKPEAPRAVTGWGWHRPLRGAACAALSALWAKDSVAAAAAAAAMRCPLCSNGETSKKKKEQPKFPNCLVQPLWRQKPSVLCSCSNPYQEQCVSAQGGLSVGLCPLCCLQLSFAYCRFLQGVTSQGPLWVLPALWDRACSGHTQP